MLPGNRLSTHPGEILLEEFLNPLGISQVAFARYVGVPVQRINEIVRGKRGVTPDTAWRLAQAFGTTPEFWMNLQSNYDLVRFRPAQIVEKIHSIDVKATRAVMTTYTLRPLTRRVHSLYPRQGGIVRGK